MSDPALIREAVDVLGRRLPDAPEVVAVLGSGLSALADGLDDAVEVPFAEVPGLPGAGVVGHAGRYVFGRIGGRPVLMQAGRLHLYEGHAPARVVAPVRIAHGLGARTVVVTNAAGGIHRALVPGSVMLIDDHLNLMWSSPLAGVVRDGEERFPDMSEPYDRELQAFAERTALDRGIAVVRGTYAAVPGPSYETPAEVAMLARLGADAVGMSTVPEVITARALGMRVLGLSLITNRAAGLAGTALSHDEVLEIGRRSGAALGGLVRALLAGLPREDGP